MRSIQFEFETKYGIFRDSLNFNDDESYTDQEIEDMKQQRLTNWLNIIDSMHNPSNQQ